MTEKETSTVSSWTNEVTINGEDIWLTTSWNDIGSLRCLPELYSQLRTHPETPPTPHQSLLATLKTLLHH